MAKMGNFIQTQSAFFPHAHGRLDLSIFTYLLGLQFQHYSKTVTVQEYDEAIEALNEFEINENADVENKELVQQVIQGEIKGFSNQGDLTEPHEAYDFVMELLLRPHLRKTKNETHPIFGYLYSELFTTTDEDKTLRSICALSTNYLTGSIHDVTPKDRRNLVFLHFMDLGNEGTFVYRQHNALDVEEINGGYTGIWKICVYRNMAIHVPLERIPKKLIQKLNLNLAQLDKIDEFIHEIIDDTLSLRTAYERAINKVGMAHYITMTPVAADKNIRLTVDYVDFIEEVYTPTPIEGRPDLTGDISKNVIFGNGIADTIHYLGCKNKL